MIAAHTPVSTHPLDILQAATVGAVKETASSKGVTMNPIITIP